MVAGKDYVCENLFPPSLTGFESPKVTDSVLMSCLADPWLAIVPFEDSSVDPLAEMKAGGMGMIVDAGRTPSQPASNKDNCPRY